MYTVRIFMSWLKKLKNTLPNYKKNSDFPSLADKIAEPHPDMNIKAAVFTVSKKSSIIRMHSLLFSIYCM